MIHIRLMLESRPFDPDTTACVPAASGAWRWAALTLAVFLLALGAVAAAADAAPRRAEIRRAAEDVLSNEEFQQAHPQAEPGLEEAAPPPEAPSASREVGGLANIGVMLLWTLALVGGALVIAFLVHELLPFVRRAKGGKGEERGVATAAHPGAPDHTAPPGTLADAERLAGQGLYGEAIHALLLACLEELRRRFDPGQPPSLTSREIARRLALNENAKAALWRPGASDYQSCLDSYRQAAAEPEAAS